MMANVSDCGELHDKLWKLSDRDKLFAHVPFPDDVIVVPELDNTLPTTHSAVGSAKVCYMPAHLQVVQRVVLDILRPRSRSLLSGEILYLSIQKGYKLSSECVEGIV